MQRGEQEPTHFKEGREQVQHQGAVGGKLVAPGFVAPAAATVPGEGCHAGPLCKSPDPGYEVALRAGWQKVSGLLPLEQ